MYGAIVGDLAGSIYEFKQLKEIQSIKMNNIIEKDAFYSDDTILTIAILDAILHNKDYDYYLRKYIFQLFLILHWILLSLSITIEKETLGVNIELS